MLKPYLHAARWIALGINPYCNITAVFFAALEEDELRDQDLHEPSEM